MAENDAEQSLELLSVERKPLREHIEGITLVTSGGDIHCVLHLAQTDQHGGIVWVGGAGGGLNGPAGGLYPRFSEELAPKGITGLRLDYRAANDFVPCVLDTMIGSAFLDSLGCPRIILVGHSFGGAVAIAAGVMSEKVVGVATLASQTAGTELAEQLDSRSIFLAHGTADTVLPDWCSRDIYQRASGPKDLHLYPGCSHGFDECRDQLEQDLLIWILGLMGDGEQMK